MGFPPRRRGLLNHHQIGGFGYGGLAPSAPWRSNHHQIREGFKGEGYALGRPEERNRPEKPAEADRGAAREGGDA